MKLNLNEIIDLPGGVIPFEYDLVLDDLEINYAKPFERPVHVTGEVRNKAGVLQLEAECSAEIRFDCSRCTVTTVQDYALTVEAILAEGLQNPDDFENSEIVLLENATVNVDEIVRSAIILESDMKFLCSDECKGICPKCGTNLNKHECSCEADIDPRLEKLKQFLNKD